MTISICRTVKCKGEKVLENTFKTLKLGWSFSKYLSGHKNVFTRRLFYFFPFACLPYKKDLYGSKIKVSIVLSANSWLVLNPGCTSESAGSPPHSRGQVPQSLWGGKDLEAATQQSPDCPWGTHPYSLVTWFPCWGLCQLRSWSFCLNESLNQLIQILPNRPSG